MNVCCPVILCQTSRRTVSLTPSASKSNRLRYLGRRQWFEALLDPASPRRATHAPRFRASLAWHSRPRGPRNEHDPSLAPQVRREQSAAPTRPLRAGARNRPSRSTFATTRRSRASRKPVGPWSCGPGAAHGGAAPRFKRLLQTKVFTIDLQV